MATISNDESEPTLEWCTGCDRPTALCECDRTPAGTRLSTPIQRPTAPEPNTEHQVETTGLEHRTPVESSRPAEPNTDRTGGGEHTDDAKHTPGFWRTGWAWLTEWGPLLPIWILAGCLGVAGFSVSFFTVEHRMQPFFGELAWVVPAAVDLGIIVFTLLDIFLARRGQRIPWMRYIPWALTASTIYLNVTAYTVLEAQVAHAVLPSLWVVFSEAIARIMREKAEDEMPTTKRVPLIRWVCAPVATLILWRAMKLWKIGTYDQALELEEERQLAKAVMKDCFGSLRTAPRTLKVRYRQRKITVAEVYGAAAKIGTASTGAPGVAGPNSSQKPRKSSSGRRSANTEDSERQVVRSGPAKRGVRSNPVRSRSSKPAGSAGDRTPRDARSSNERLSEALAELRDEGIVDPSVRALAARAGCSTSTAHTFKKGLGDSGGT